MTFFKNTLWVKRIAILISVVIVSLILWNTYVFFQKFKQEERVKMEVYASAMEELATNTDLNASTKLPLKVLESIKNVPMILVDADENIIDSYHLDTIKAKSTSFLERELQKMKKQNKPVVIKHSGITQYVYYKDSDLLNKLTYYPLALILILVLFLSVIYMVFTSNKIAEQNKLWTGMAKETAHQIGTPLSSLLGWIAILKMEKVDDKYVDEIEKDVHRLNTIADRFSKIGSVPELKPQNIVTIAKTAFDYLESRSSKQITFHFATSTDEINVQCNKELFGWVIENLIKNAIDAMQGKGIITFKMTETDKKVKINIADTGKGIPKSVQQQIFKPGFTTKKRGWGLGLSLSKRIIEDYHKGKIYVKNSEMGKGTTFEILLSKVS